MQLVDGIEEDGAEGTAWRKPRALQNRRVLGNSFPGFRLERQRQTKWCWAAVSKGIAEYLERRPGTVSQIQMAFEILGNPEVLINPEAFNDPQSIVPYWRRRQRMVAFRNAPLSEHELRSEVGPAGVVVATIAWRSASPERAGDDNHFVVVSGWFRPRTECKFIVHDSDAPDLMAYWSYAKLRYAYRYPKACWIQSSLMRRV